MQEGEPFWKLDEVRETTCVQGKNRQSLASVMDYVRSGPIMKFKLQRISRLDCSFGADIFITELHGLVAGHVRKRLSFALVVSAAAQVALLAKLRPARFLLSQKERDRRRASFAAFAAFAAFPAFATFVP